MGSRERAGRRRGARLVIGALACAVGLTALPAVAQAGPNDPFTTLAPGFTQELYGTGLPFAGGVAFAPNGDPLVSFGDLWRFDSHSTITQNGSTIHPVRQMSANNSLGLANDPAGNVYANVGSGVVRIDPNTGAQLAGPGGPGGDGLGIVYDAKTSKLVYAGGSGISFVAPDFSSAGTFSTETSGDGIAFSPDDAFLFAAENNGINVVDSATGHVVQFVADTTGHCCADGMAFHASAPRFVLANNTDGSITRYDFPNDDYTQPPAQSNFADGGFRGDLTDVGADGCLYLTQSQTRFGDGTVTGEGSLVKLCGGFTPPVPPAPVKTVLVANPSIVQLSGLKLYLKLSARLTKTDGSGIPNEPITFTAAGQNICTAKTDANGNAACSGFLNGVLQSVLGLGYKAAFAGDGLLLPSSATGPLIK